MGLHFLKRNENHWLHFNKAFPRNRKAVNFVILVLLVVAQASVIILVQKETDIKILDCVGWGFLS